MDDGLQFLDVELDAAVAGEADDALAFARYRRADRRRQIVPHRSRAGVRDQPLPGLQPRRLVGHDAGRGIAAHHHVIVGELVKQLLDEIVRIERRARLAMLLLHHRIAYRAVRGSFASQRRVPRCAIVRFRQLPQHLPQKDLQVAVDSEIGTHRGLSQFGGIHVHLHHEGIPRKRRPVITHLPDVQPRSQHQQRVRSSAR